MSKARNKAPDGAGTLEWRGDRVYARITLEDGRRKRIKLGKGLTEARARETMAAYLERIRVQGLVLQKEAPERRNPDEIVTVRQLGDAWTSGELLKRYGRINGLRHKKSADKDRYRLKRYVYPIVGDRPLVEIQDIDIDRVMANGRADWAAKTQQQLYLLLHRLFELAIAPLRLRKDNPVTHYHRPAKGAQKMFSYLYPSELLAVLACKDVPLARRILYALAVYTGLRKGSLYALTWAGVDFEHGTLLSTTSKTGIAQLFEIPADLVLVLQRWRQHLGAPVADSLLIPRDQLELPRVDGEAEALRGDLKLAGVTRAVLFEKAVNVEPIRFHDLRATFVTWAKRAGRGDGWISDRTGHLTPEMIDRYSRAARTLADLKIAPFPDLSSAIPELSSPLSTPSST